MNLKSNVIAIIGIRITTTTASSEKSDLLQYKIDRKIDAYSLKNRVAPPRKDGILPVRFFAANGKSSQGSQHIEANLHELICWNIFDYRSCQLTSPPAIRLSIIHFEYKKFTFRISHESLNTISIVCHWKIHQTRPFLNIGWLISELKTYYLQHWTYIGIDYRFSLYTTCFFLPNKIEIIFPWSNLVLLELQYNTDLQKESHHDKSTKPTLKWATLQYTRCLAQEPRIWASISYNKFVFPSKILKF